MEQESTELPVSPDDDDDADLERSGMPERGDSVGRYVVLDRLGAGGMGVVFAAWDPELDRRVAIKLISDRSPNLHRHLRARLKREAQAMARLRHPNVVNVYDVGEADGRLFVAMEYIDGISLRRWLEEAERSGPEILAMFRSAGEGLAAAHAHGVIHRDFKPDNVLIAADGRVLVLDFGLASWANGSSSAEHPIESSNADEDEPPADSGEHARAENSRRDDHTMLEGSSGARPSEELETDPGNLTMPGAVIGTPAYMAPEQHRGQPTDARSDQFSFCAALWEALTGKLPFGRGPLLLARARTAKLGSFERRDVPAEVEQALRRGLAFAPQDRWPDMRSLLDALIVRELERRWAAVLVPACAVLIGIAIAQIGRDSRPSAAASCDDGEVRVARVWQAAKADELALALGRRGRLAEQTWPYLRAELDRWSESWIAVDRELCRRYWQVATVDGGVRGDQLACLDRQLGHLEQLVEVLATVSEDELAKTTDMLATLPNPQTCRDVARSSVIERHIAELDPFGPSQHVASRRLPLLRDPVVQAELDAALSRAELELELSRLNQVDEHSARLLEQTKARGLERQHLRAAKLRAQLLVVRRQAHSAIDLALVGLEAAERLADPSLRLDALLEVADIHASGGDTIAAARWLRPAQALAGELVLDRATRARLAAVEAHVAMTDGRFAEALAAWDRALAATVPEQERFVYIERLHSRATVLFMAGQAAEGLEQLRRCEQMYSELVGPKHAGVLAIRIDIAHALENLDELEQSRAAYLAVAADLEEAHDGPTDLSIAARSHAAAALGRLGDCERALAEFEPLIGPARELMAYPSAVLGNLLRRRASLCDYATPDAVDYARQAVAMYQEALTDLHSSTAATHAELGIALLVAGDPAAAGLAAARALELFEALDPERKDEVALPKRRAAQALLMLSRAALGESGALVGAEMLLAELPEDSSRPGDRAEKALLRERLTRLQDLP